jgi:hypothetical protein
VPAGCVDVCFVPAGCHVNGGNVVQAGATLFTDDLQKNNVGDADSLYQLIYQGKARMPGFGQECAPKVNRQSRRWEFWGAALLHSLSECTTLDLWAKGSVTNMFKVACSPALSIWHAHMAQELQGMQGLPHQINTHHRITRTLRPMR